MDSIQSDLFAKMKKRRMLNFETPFVNSMTNSTEKKIFTGIQTTRINPNALNWSLPVSQIGLAVQPSQRYEDHEKHLSPGIFNTATPSRDGEYKKDFILKTGALGSRR